MVTSQSQQYMKITTVKQNKQQKNKHSYTLLTSFIGLERAKNLGFIVNTICKTQLAHVAGKKTLEWSNTRQSHMLTTSGALTYTLTHHTHFNYSIWLTYSFLSLKHSLDDTSVWITERNSSTAIDLHTGFSKRVQFNAEHWVHVKGQCIDPSQRTAGMNWGGMGINFLKAPVFSLQQPLYVTGGRFCSSHQISEHIQK